MLPYFVHTEFKARLKAHLARAGRVMLPAIFIWAIVGFTISRLSGLRTEAVVTYDIAGAVMCGLLLGTAMSWFETRPIRDGYINRFPWLDLALRTVLYIGVLTVVILIGRFMLFSLFPNEAAGEVWRPISEAWQDMRVRRFVILMFLATFIINFFLHIRLVFGQGYLSSLFTGRYRLPVKEERLFVFIDLIDSTRIAQEIGALQFTHFKHDFFCELTAPLLKTNGNIVQYVGDEVMITWKKNEVYGTSSPLDFITLSRKRFADRHEYYQKRYGFVPSFRTGIHAGEVIVSEVGDLRRDIVYSGDVVNTAARLLQSCRPTGCSLLISDEACSWLTPSVVNDLKIIDPLTLRGRQAAIGCKMQVSEEVIPS